MNLVSILASITVSSLYVLAIYLIPADIQRLPRDNPKNMTARMIAVTIAALANTILTILILSYNGHDSDIGFAILFGYRFDNVLSVIVSTVLLMAIFYLGPLTTLLIYLATLTTHSIESTGLLILRDRPKSLSEVAGEVIDSHFIGIDRLTIFRNIVFAPVSEEVVYRGLVFPLLFTLNCGSADTSRHRHYSMITAARQCPMPTMRTLLIICPIMFGLAHVHHFLDKIRSGQTIVQASIPTIIQFTYTTIFGLIAVILFARTGSIVAPILSHIICNIVGLPNIGFMTPPITHPHYQGSGYRSVPEYAFMYSYRYIHLILHAVGLVLFAWALFPVTSELAFDSYYWRHLFLNDL